MLTTYILFGCMAFVLALYTGLSGYMLGGLARITKDKTKGLKGDTPKASVVIAMRNEGYHIDDLINSLAKQIYPPNDFELIIIDDQSDDWHYNKVKNRLLRSSIRHYQLLRNPGTGKKAALAYGIKNASHEIILQTDGDVILDSLWIWGMTRRLRNKYNGVVLGQVEMIPQKSIWSKYAALDFLSLQAATLAFTLRQKPIMANGANFGFMRETYSRFGKKHHNYASGDDVFLVQEAAKNGIEVNACVSAQSLVKTAAPPNFKAYINQRVRWGSKTGGYPSVTAKITAAIVALSNAAVPVGLIICFFKPDLWVIYLAFALSKIIMDFSITAIYASRFQQRKLLAVYPWVALLHPFITCYIILLILIRPNQMEWKKRKVPVVK